MNEFDTIFYKNNVALHHSLTNITERIRILSNLLSLLSYQNENKGENNDEEEKAPKTNR
jgi:hypothetical protein